MNTQYELDAPVTLCLTIGKRPDLLKRTLDSLLCQVQFSSIIAINDFRDEATNDMFRTLCPEGQLISLDHQLGHHKAADYMYERITTPYVLHCEDDWLFDSSIDLNSAMRLLDSDPQISQVCLRKISDFHLSEADRARVLEVQHAAQPYYRMDPLHAQWHGYTFNPHLAKLDLWNSLGGFSQFEKERHISRNLRSKGRFTAYIKPGCCEHIGELKSVSPSAPPSTGLRLWRKRLKALLLGRH
jgi:hypothetical protein